MSDEKPDKFRIAAPDLSKHAEERITSSGSSSSRFKEIAIGVGFIVILPFFLIVLLIGFIVWSTINGLRGNKNAAPNSLSEEELAKLLEDANQGDMQAQYSLGCRYDNGSGVIRDYKENNYQEAAGLLYML